MAVFTQGVCPCSQYAQASAGQMTCLRSIFSLSGTVIWPADGCVYNMSMVNPSDSSLSETILVGPGLYLDCRNCVITNVVPSIYQYVPPYGWVVCTDGSNNAVNCALGVSTWSYDKAIFTVNEHTTMTNMTIRSAVPSQGVDIDGYANYVTLTHLTIGPLPAVFFNPTGASDPYTTSISSPNRWAINIDTNAFVEVGWCTIFNVGYGIIGDAPYTNNVNVHDNHITHTTADGICLNQPTYGDELGQLQDGPGYYDAPYFVSNWTIANNYIANTGVFEAVLGSGVWQQVNSLSIGFCSSAAGGWNITWTGNTMINCSYQAIHLEANSAYIYIYNNVMDTILTDQNGHGNWLGYVNCIWVGNTYWLVISGNTMTRCYDSAVFITPVPTAYCVDNTGINLQSGLSTGYRCIPYPVPMQFSQEITITNNNFVSWGIQYGCHDFAVFLDNFAYQVINAVVSGNTYSSQWAQYDPTSSAGGGSCQESNRYVWCPCTPFLGITVNEPSISLSTCSSNQYTCSLLDTTSGGSAEVMAFTANSIYVDSVADRSLAQTGQYNAVAWATTTYPLASWTDYSGTHTATGPGATVMPGPWGQPGVSLTGASLATSPASSWPTSGASYSVALILLTTSASATGPIFGRVQLASGGRIALVHGSTSALGPALPVNLGQLVLITYNGGNGAVTFYVNGTFTTSTASLSGATNSDGSANLGGGGFQGMVWHAQLWSAVLSSSDAQSLMAYHSANMNTDPRYFNALFVAPLPPPYPVAAVDNTPASLVQWFPLQGGSQGVVSGGPTFAQVSGSTSCLSFPGTNGPLTFSCAAQVQASSFIESGDFSICFYIQPLEAVTVSPTIILSCQNYGAGTVDCATLALEPPAYPPAMVLLLHYQGNGVGGSPAYGNPGISTNVWSHICVTYSPTTTELLGFLNGNQIMTAHIAHTSSSYGIPMLDGSVLQMACANWRIYTGLLTAPQIQALVTSDYPNSSAPPPTQAPPTPTPSSTGGGGSGGGAVLAQYFPLIGNTQESVSGGTFAQVYGSSSCVGFPSGSSSPLTLSCPAVVQASSFTGEGGDFSICFYVAVATSFTSVVPLLSCTGFWTGAQDCLAIDAIADNVFAIQVNHFGNGVGGSSSPGLANNAWTHLCGTYSATTGALNGYVNGQNSGLTTNVAHTTSNYGFPAINGSDVQLSVAQWRMYTGILTPAQVASLSSNDYPSVAPTAASSGGGTSTGGGGSQGGSGGLVNWLPLMGSLADSVATSQSATVQGSSSCQGFASAGGVSNAWTQTCTTSGSTLALAYSTESSDASVCAAFWVTSYPGAKPYLFVCNSESSVDCITVYYLTQYSVVVAQLSPTSNGTGGAQVLPTNSWFHLCVTYSTSAAAMTIYYNGVNIQVGSVTHTHGTYGQPVLAGYTDGTGSLPASIVNWKIYNTAISAQTVAALATSDTPANTGSGGGGTQGGTGTVGSLSRFMAIAPTASSQLVRVSSVTDSIGFGLYSSKPDTTTTATHYLGRLRTKMQASWGDGGSGYVSIAHSQTYVGTTAYNLNNLGCYYTGSWALNPGRADRIHDYQDIAAFSMESTSTGDYVQFSVRGSVMTLYYIQCSSCGTLSVTVDGQSVLNVNGYASSDASVSVSVPVPTSNNPHLVTVTNTGSGTTWIQGLDCHNTAGVVLDQYALPGQRLIDYNAATGAVYQSGSVGGPRQASLLILELGVASTTHPPAIA